MPNTHKLILTIKANNPVVHGLIIGSVVDSSKLESSFLKVMKAFTWNLDREFNKYKKKNPESLKFAMPKSESETEIEIWCDEDYAMKEISDFGKENKKFLNWLRRNVKSGVMKTFSMSARVEKL
jgi:hypothetical protein